MSFSYRRTYGLLPAGPVKDQIRIIFDELDYLSAVNGGTPVYLTGGALGMTTGTQGGIPYFSSGTSLSSSALLGLNRVVIGGGATGSPTAIAMPSLASRYALTATTGTASPLYTLATATATADAIVLRHSDGGAAFASLTAATITATSATLTGSLQLGGGFFALGGATITGTSILANVTITGTLNASGAANVFGAASLGSTLVVAGGATIAGATNLANATVTGAFNANTGVFAAGVTVAGVTNLQAVTIGGAANFSMAANIFGAVSLGSTLDVAGRTNLAATTITGALNAAAATFTGSLIVGDGLVAANRNLRINVPANREAAFQIFKGGSSKWEIYSGVSSDDLRIYSGSDLFTFFSNGALAIVGGLSVGNTTSTAVGASSTHKVQVTISGVTMYLLATDS